MRSAPEIVRDAWEIYLARPDDDQGDSDGASASVVFDLGHAEEREHQGYQACRRVILHAGVTGFRRDGLMHPRELHRLASVEAELIAALAEAGADCRKVAHLTCGATRDIVFQVEAGAAPRFAAVVARWQAAVARDGLRSELLESAGWAFFDQRVRPQPHHWAWISNRRVVDQLRAAGSDVARPHRLEHVFLGGVAALEALALALRGADLPDQTRDGDRLTVVQRLPLDVDQITTWTLHFESLATTHGATYDGWGPGRGQDPGV